MLLLDVCLDEADGPLEVRCDDVVQRVAAVDEEVVDLLADVVWVRADGEDGGDVERAEGWLRRRFNRAEVDVRDNGAERAETVVGTLRRGARRVFDSARSGAGHDGRCMHQPTGAVK